MESDSKFKIIDCPKCGFKHLYPLPKENDIKEFYKSQYYQKETTNILSFTKERNEEKWSSLAWSDRLEIFKQHLGKGPRKLLDIGCGNGFFLKFMKENNWEVTGIEPSSLACKHARSLDVEVLRMTIEEFVQSGQSSIYDGINLKNVLEHVSNPKKILQISKFLLDPNHGIICVQVPNEFNPLQLRAAEILNKSNYWIISEHINYFNFESLESLVRSTGFQVVHRTADFPMELFLLMEENYKDNEELGSKCHRKRMNFEMALSNDLRRNIYTKLASVGLGRNCIVYAKI